MTRDLLSLRPYQREAIDAVYDAHERGDLTPAVVLPTGSGKTVIFSHMAAEHLAVPGYGRVLILVHRDELADQAISKLRTVAPHLSVGKVKAGDNEVEADVVVASVQTLARPRRLEGLFGTPRAWERRLRTFDLVITDECQHATAPTYRTISDVIRCYATDGYPTRFVGFTATLARGDGQGLGDVWSGVVYSKSVLWMISRGYLVDPRAKAVDVSDLDLSAVKRTAGDYQAKALGAAMIKADAPELIAQAVRHYAGDRRPIVFTPDVATAVATADALSDGGTVSAVISGKTPRDERRRIYSAYRSGEIKAVVNCMVLTEGADFPWADCAVIARPTTNPVLYVQMVGRVLRPFPGKTDALVLDIGGRGGTLATLVDLSGGDVTAVRDGESLANAAVREEEEADAPIGADSVVFDLKHREFDLFTASDQVWLTTPAGVLFIPAGDGEVFIWPSEEVGLWDVCAAQGRAPWVRLHTALTLGPAQAWAETEAEEYQDFNTRKQAGWRRTKPSEGQLNFARSIKAEVTEEDRKGQVSDAISVRLASRKFDRYARKIK